MATKTAGEPNSGSSATTSPPGTADDERTSRAVLRTVEAGSYVDCVLCDERIKFQAKHRHQQVICNVYVDGIWDRVEHFHAPCYEEAEQPYGEPAA